MNLSDTLKLITALKSKGVLHFKSMDFEVHFGGGGDGLLQTRPIPETLPYIEPPSPPPIDPIATQKAQDLIDLLKLKDDDLVNHIFPDGAQI